MSQITEQQIIEQQRNDKDRAKDRAKYSRRLCYRHACQEFDKLPNCQRYKASWWIMCKPEICEMCNTPLPEPEGAGWCKPHREANGWSEQYGQF